MDPPHWAMSNLFSCQRAYYQIAYYQRSEARQTARRYEPRAQESSASVYGSPAGMSPQAAYSGEARAPKSIIQEGKKGLRGLTIVFMEIRAVTGFLGKI